MGKAMSKTVKLLLEDGTLKGIINNVNSGWQIRPSKFGGSFNCDRAGMNRKYPPLMVGHDPGCFSKDGAISREVFVEMLSVEIANHDSIDIIKRELPETYAAFKDLIGKYAI